ncbi:hypothetical protein SAMN04487934_10331 [Eubacterium ruminantium]|nr:hypothetical protein SAMN04487934_10331 [Eubacterium ruminantium]
MKEIDDEKDGSILQDDNQINTDSSKLDDQINTDSIKKKAGDAKEGEKQTRKQKKEALWAQFLQNRRDAVIDYSDYEEYETLGEMKEAYEAQPTIEDKFYYYINLQARSGLLSGSVNHLTEKERVALGMYPNIFENKIRPGRTAAPISHDQDNREYDMTMDFLHDLRLEFFANDQGKKSVTVEGCRGFMEMMGRVSVKPYVDFGRHYDEIRNSLPKEGNTEKDLDYKTNYIMMNGLVREQEIANQVSFQINDLEEKFNNDMDPVEGSGQFYSYVNISDFIVKEIRKYKEETIESFLDHMQITDKEERRVLLDDMKCTKNDKVKTGLSNIKSISETSYKDESLAAAISAAWRNQGIKKVLGTLSDKDIVAWRRGTRAVETRGNYKYKKWMQDHGDPICEKMYRKGIKDALKTYNKKLISTEPVGYKFSDDTKLISFSTVEGKVAAANRALTAVPVDAEREAAKVKYDTYIASHTGLRRLSADHEKNVEMLSKAMAASMVKDSPDTRSYSVKMIHCLADKLKVSLKLSEMTFEKVREILTAPENISKAIKDRSTELYLPTDENNARRNYVNALNKLSNVMMKSFDRSDEYKAMAKYIKNIGSLESYYKETPEGKAEMIENGVNLLQATEAYMKGKKSVRHSEDGKERFDNAIDVLAVIHKYLPEMRGRVEKVVERINKVRGAENMNHKDHVDITKYGPERAEKAALERMKRDSGAKEKDLKNIRPAKL